MRKVHRISKIKGRKVLVVGSYHFLEFNISLLRIHLIRTIRSLSVRLTICFKNMAINREEWRIIGSGTERSIVDVANCSTTTALVPNILTFAARERHPANGWEYHA